MVFSLIQVDDLRAREWEREDKGTTNFAPMTMTRKTRYNAPSIVSEMWKLIQKKPSNRLQRLEGQGFTKYFLFSQIFQTKVQLLRAKKVFHHCNSKQLFWGYVDVRTKAALVVFFLFFVLSSPSFRKMKEKWMVKVESFIFQLFQFMKL